MMQQCDCSPCPLSISLEILFHCIHMTLEKFMIVFALLIIDAVVDVGKMK